MCRFEHPAGDYKKIFETVEELSEPLPATVTGMFSFYFLHMTLIFSLYYPEVIVFSAMITLQLL